MSRINVKKLPWPMMHVTRPLLKLICSHVVGSVKVNFLSYRYRADKSTIFGMRGLLGLTINSRGKPH